MINAVILSIPLFLSWWRPVAYHKYWSHVAKSILIVGVPFIIWNLYAASAGHWWWNPKHITGMTLGGLPIEEWLFFITVPYSSLFFYQAVKTFLPSKMVAIPSIVISSLALILFATGLIQINRHYTAIVCILGGLVTLIYQKYARWLFTHSHALLYLSFGFITFTIFNTLLTAYPVVEYDPSHIVGFRLGAIPLEDAIYNYILLSSYLVVYRLSSERQKNAK
jgi:lycopene cyclase domain-containing protein